MNSLSQRKSTLKNQRTDAGSVNYYVTLFASIICFGLWLSGGAQLQAQSVNGGNNSSPSININNGYLPPSNACNETVPNTPPVFDPTSSITIQEPSTGIIQTVTVGAFDSEGTEMSLLVELQGVIIRNVTQNHLTPGRVSAVITFTAPNVGSQAINVTATDEQGAATTIQIPVQVLSQESINQPILFGPIEYQTVTVGQPINFQVYAYDNDSNITLAPTVIPPGVTHSSSSPYEGYAVTNFDWTPQQNQIGTHDIQLSATDVGPLGNLNTTKYRNLARATIRIKVVNPLCGLTSNTAPLVDPVSSLQLHTNQKGSVSLGAIDKEKQMICLLVAGPNIIGAHNYDNEPGRASLSMDYRSATTGTQYVSIFVMDQARAATVMSLPMVVVDSNQGTSSPIRFSPLYHDTVRVGQNINFQAYVSNEDDEIGVVASAPPGSIVYPFSAMGGAPQFGPFLTNKVSVHWIPQANQVGTYDIHLLARDFHYSPPRDVAQATVRIKVVDAQSPTNTAPLLDPVSSFQIQHSHYKTITIGATDDELQPMKLWISGCDGLFLPIQTLEDIPGRIRATVDLSGLALDGKYDLSVVAQDSHGATSQVYIPIEYGNEGISEDSPIQFGPLVKQTVNVGQPLNLQPYVTDDNDYLNLYAGVLSGSTASTAQSILGRNTLNVGWTPGSLQRGVFNMNLFGSDNAQAEADQFHNIAMGTIRIRVEDGIDRTAPTGSINIYSGNAYTRARYIPVTLSATDSQSGLGAGAQMKFSEDGNTWTAPEAYATTKYWNFLGADGVRNLYVKFKDVAGNWSDSYLDTIYLDTVNPVLSPFQAVTYNATNGTYTFTVTASDSGSGIDDSKMRQLVAKLTINPTTGAYAYTGTQYITMTYTGNSYIAVVPSTAFGPNGIVTRVTANDKASNVNQMLLQRFNSSMVGQTPVALDKTPPTVPTNLQATFLTLTSIQVSWAASSDNEGFPVNYNVYRNGVYVAKVSGLTFTDVGLTPSILSMASTYNYTVAAVDNLNNTSAQSSAITRIMPMLSTKFDSDSQVWTKVPINVYTYSNVDDEYLAQNFMSYDGYVVDGPFTGESGLSWLVYWPELDESGYVYEQYIERTAVISWVNTANVTVNGNTLTKTAGSNAWNAGPESTLSFTGNGGVQFRAVASNLPTSTMCGLSSTTLALDTNYTSIEYALYLNGLTSSVRIYERGVLKATLGNYSANDVFSIERVGSTIIYKKNGVAFYNSSRLSNSTTPLVVDTAFYHENLSGLASVLTDVKFINGVATVPSAVLNLAASSGDGQVQLFWSSPLLNGSAITGYEIQYGPTGGTMVTLQDDAVPGALIQNLSNNVHHTFRVIALNGIGRGPIAETNSKPNAKISVTWETADSENVTIAGNQVTKTAGGSADWNAGARTAPIFRADGGIEFTARQDSTNVMIGLAKANLNPIFTSIDYTIYMNGTDIATGGTIKVYESGTLISEFGSYFIGDVFTIERIGSTVYYKRNGQLFYTSTKPSIGELTIDSSILHVNGTIDNAQIVGLFPEVPEQVTMVSGLSANGAVQLFWNAPVNNGSNIIGYTVQYRASGTANFLTYNTPNASPKATITGLTNGTGYELQVYARNARGNGPVSNLIQMTPRVETNVVWNPASLVNVTATPTANSLTKTTGGNSWNGGATSTASYTGNVIMKFTATQDNTNIMGGFSLTNTDANYTTMDFALYMHGIDSTLGGTVKVYERGVQRTTTPAIIFYRIGDVFTVERSGQTIIYRHNGTVVYTSTRVLNPNDQLLVDSSIFHQGTVNGVLSDVKITQPSENGQATPILKTDVTWVNLVGVTATGNSITKISASNTWGTGGAVSSQSITGDGSAEFIAGQTTHNLMAGLSRTNPDAGYTSIEFAIYFQAAGTIQIRESGTSMITLGSYTTGDVFSIERRGTTITYKKNGALIYTSTKSSSGNLLLDAAIYTTGGNLNNAKFTGVSP